MKKIYTSDLSDAEWQVIKKRFPEKIIRRKRNYEIRIIINAILYVLKNGCLWRDLPKDFPPYKIVNYYFNSWKKNDVWNDLHEQMYGDCREKAGRERSRSMGLIDSQSVKTDSITSQDVCGIDAGKKIKGRKRHILTDTSGFLISILVHTADIQDRDGAVDVLKRICQRFPWLRHIFADGGYAGDKLRTALAKAGNWVIEIIKRSDQAKGFEVLPRRWVVERTFAWLGRCRRLAKDWEATIASSTAWAMIASIRMLICRTARYCYD